MMAPRSCSLSGSAASPLRPISPASLPARSLPPALTMLAAPLRQLLGRMLDAAGGAGVALAAGALFLGQGALAIGSFVAGLALFALASRVFPSR